MAAVNRWQIADWRWDAKIALQCENQKLQKRTYGKINSCRVELTIRKYIIAQTVGKLFQNALSFEQPACGTFEEGPERSPTPVQQNMSMPLHT
jgi:hypothetical protein